MTYVPAAVTPVGVLHLLYLRRSGATGTQPGNPRTTPNTMGGERKNEDPTTHHFPPPNTSQVTPREPSTHYRGERDN